jgi:hypothetical protein
MKAMNTSLELSGSRSRPSHPHFWEILLTHRRQSECSNPRDRIYSLLAINASDGWFRVDYSERLCQLFCRTADCFEAWMSETHVYDLWRALRLSSDDVMAGTAAEGNGWFRHIPVHNNMICSPRRSS